MSTKDTKKSYKGLISIIVVISMILSLIVLYKLTTVNNVFATNAKIEETKTGESLENNKISNATPINIEEIIKKNINFNQEEYYTEEVELEYLTTYNTNPELPKGMVQVIQEGRTGLQEITKKKIYENGEVISEEQIGSKVIKASVNKIVEIGGANYSNSYKVKVGDIVYVTSDRIAVMTEPSEESEKVATLEKDTELKVQAIQDGWYKITSSSARGFVKSENVTYINKNEKQEEKNTSGGKITKPSFNMALNKPSGLSLEQFKKVLTDSNDKNKIFINNAQYFYYIENQYNINGLFVASIGIHESAWGTSQIAQNKNNLFGYGAYDSNPYNGAYNFKNYSESIDLLARVLVKYYLNPKGTNIYGGEKAVATYYNGPTLTGVNTKYASDKNWANAVYKYMQYLYNKL